MKTVAATDFARHSTLHHDEFAGVPMPAVNISATRMGTCLCRPKPLTSCLRMASFPFREEMLVRKSSKIGTEQVGSEKG